MEKLRNRLFACGIAAFTLLNALPLQTALPAFAAEVEAANRGDINGDGKKDSADLEVLTALLGKRPDTIIADTDELARYDVTQDGIVDVRDRYAMSQFLNGKAKELPLDPGKKSEETVTMTLSEAECFPGDEVSMTLSFVDWTKDIAAYDITVGFDTSLTLKKVEFLSGDCQYVPAARTVKLSGLHRSSEIRRGDFAVLTFEADKTGDGEFPVSVEAANIFSSEYDLYQPVNPASAVTVYPLCEPVALEAAGIGSKTVSLTWDMPFTDQPVTGYRVYRGGEMIAETENTDYTDAGLNPDTAYTYTVSAVTASGTETAESVPVTVQTAGPKIVSMDFPADTVSDANSDLTVRLAHAVPLSSLKLTYQGEDGKSGSETADLEGADLSTITRHWNVSELPAGSYQITVTVTDTDGTEAVYKTAVKVKNSPLKPVTLKASAGGRSAELSWTLASEAAVTGYNVYRMQDDGKTWEKIAEIKKRDTLTYTDSALTAGKEYTYAVTSIDSFGQESPMSTSVTVKPEADTVPPEITLFKPAGGQHVSGEITVSIGAEDSSDVAFVRCDLSADEGKTWETVGKKEGGSGSWKINTASYPDGVYRIRAVAEDNDKNTTDGKKMIELAFDNTAPAQIKNVRTVQVTETTATLAWDEPADQDCAYFMVIVSDGKNTREEKVTGTLGINLKNLEPGITYTVTVYAADTAGNAGKASDPFRFDASGDSTPPVISAFGVSADAASANVPLTVKVTASDHSKVTERYLEYSQDQKTWKRLTLTDPSRDFYITDNTLEEGTLYLRAFAKDEYGNTGRPVQIHELPVDNTAPPAPGKAAVSDEPRCNAVSWTASETDENVTYRVERSKNADGKYYSVIADRLNALKYEDTDVSPDGIYYYRVSALDAAGNVSKPAETGKLKRTPDTEKPVITECSLSQQEILCAAHRTLQIMATDNIRVETITVIYCCSGDDETWKTLPVTEQRANSARTELIVRAELPESVLQTASVQLKVTAEDAAGNFSEREFGFQVDNHLAVIENAAAALAGNQVNISWSCPDVTGVVAFYVYRRIGAAGTEACVSKVDPQAKVKDYGCADTKLSNGGDMYYRIEAEMESGNTVSVSLPPITVKAIPFADLVYTPVQVLGAEYTYDARGSMNAADITSIVIDFGDTERAEKQSVENAVFTHAYQKAGSYEVSLTVTNSAGMTDTFTAPVTVSEPAVMGNVLVKVMKTDGNPAAYATVYSDVGTDRQTRYKTDGNGRVLIPCTAGTHAFGVFDSGYLPATKYCTIVPDSTTELTITVQEDQLVKADFTVSRMSLAEIEAAGIDVEDPENCQMVRLNINMTYHLSGNVTDHIVLYHDPISGKTYTEEEIRRSHGTGKFSTDFIYEVKEVSRDVNTVVMMRVPAEAKFLKDFFKVDMIVLNNASGDFSLTNCTASLNLPEGLTLMDKTPASNPRVVSLGTIGGGTQSQTSWIVRGDRSGNYQISADFQADLQPFKEHVSMHFVNSEPVKVNGREAAFVNVNFDPVIRKNNLFVEIVVENDTSEDMNKVSADIGQVLSSAAGYLSAKSELYQTRFIDTDNILQIVESAEEVPVLHPGQKLSFVFQVSNLLSGSIPDLYKKTKAEIAVDANSRNWRVCVTPVSIQDVDSPLYGLDFDAKKDFLFLIKNRNREPIPDAAFELYQFKDGAKTVIAECVSDADGRVVVPRGKSQQDYCIRVTPDKTEYEPYVNSRYRFTWQKEKYSDTIVLHGEYTDSDYDVTRAYFTSKTDHVNLVTQKHAVRLLEEIEFSIVGASALPGVKYELRQKDEKNPVKITEGDSGTFAFMELKPGMFIAERPVFIRVYTEKGDYFDTDLGLDIQSIDYEHPENNPDIQKLVDAFLEFIKNQDWCFSDSLLWEDERFGGKIGQSVMSLLDDLTEVYNSMNLTFGWPKKTGKDKNGKDKISAATGHTIGLSAARNEKDNTLEVGFEIKFKKPLKFLSPGDDDSKPSRGTSFMLSLSVKGTYDLLTYQFSKMDVKVTPKANVYTSVIPAARLMQTGAYWDVVFSGTGELPIDLELGLKPVGHSFKIDKFNKIEADLNVIADVELQLGVRFTELVRAWAFAEATGTFTVKVVTINPDGVEKEWPHLKKAKIIGSMGIRSQIWDLRWLDTTFYSIDSVLYDENDTGAHISSSGEEHTGADRSLRPPVIVLDDQTTETGTTVAETVNDAASYQPFTADMIPQAGAWNGQLGDGLTELQTGISGGSDPVLVSDGTNTLMVWIVKDISRGIDNAPYAVWSRFDSNTGIWSEPKAVDDNGNADTAPVLFAGADGIRIAYPESGKIYADDETPEIDELFRNFVFRTAKFDPEKDAFTDFRTADINQDGGAASAPQYMQAADGTTYLVWHSNADGDIFGSGKNSILCAKETADGWDTPVVLAENLPMICSLTCGQNAAGEPVCAYTCAEDDSAALYLTSLNGETVKLASGQVSSPQFAKIPGTDASGLIWYQDGTLYVSADLAKAEELCSSDDFCVSNRFAVAGDRILFLSNVEKGSALYSTQYDAETKSFTAPVCIESGENLYYESLSLAEAAGDTLYAMSRTTIDSSGETNKYETVLTGGVLAETSDIRVADTAFSFADIEAGEKFPVAVEICNDGTVPVESLTMQIRDEAGRVFASDTQEAKIISGGTEVVVFEPVIPELPEAAVYTVTVSESDTDRTPENNSDKLDLSRTDIGVDAELTYFGDKTLVTIYATNYSLAPAQAVLHIQPEQAEEETLTLYSDEIAPQQTVFWQMDAADLLGDLYRDFVYITADAGETDADPDDNTMTVMISKSGMDPGTPGDVNLDGKVELEDAMLTLRCYTRKVANLEDTGLSYIQQCCADTDEDGEIDVTDAMAILRYYVNSIAGKATGSFTEFLKQEQNGGANHESE